MTQEERGGIVGTYSSGVKTTLKVGIKQMETTNCTLIGWQFMYLIAIELSRMLLNN